MDEEIPLSWRKADRMADGSLKDLVKLAIDAVDKIPGVAGLVASEYETGMGHMHLRVWRPQKKEIPEFQKKKLSQGYVSQASFVGSLDAGNPWLFKTVLAPSMNDLSNILHNLAYENDSFENGESLSLSTIDYPQFQKRLKAFFAHTSIDKLKTPETGWQLPFDLLPTKATWDVIAIKRNGKISQLILPPEAKTIPQLLQQKSSGETVFESGILSIDGGNYHLTLSDQEAKTLTSLPRLIIPGGIMIPAALISGTAERSHKPSDLLFHGSLTVQGSPLSGTIRYGTLEIGHAHVLTQFDSNPLHSPYWAYTLRSPEQVSINLPLHPSLGEGVLLPRGFRESGALLGDTGYLSYHAPSPTGIHEQKVPFFVAGFYDPGIIPIGGKFILANPAVTAQIRASYNQEDNLAGNGLNVRFNDRDQADKIKTQLLAAFKAAGIEDYWKVETFREYEFTRDVIQQLQSDKHLFSLLAALIIIVACSNIISMLIILVNDKKTEIGILRSMGASSLSIAAIFGSCGIFMGVIGSLTGTIAAIVTLKNLQPLVKFISWIQGYEMFNPLFYGENLPTELSFETMTFVITATAVISLLSGLIPAIKASMLKPSAILKSE